MNDLLSEDRVSLPSSRAECHSVIEISVVIPCRNALRTIRDCLEALIVQDTRYRYEMIVIDSSTDGTDNIISNDFPQVALVHFPCRVRCGEARNLGVDLASGRIIVFIDSDCVAPPYWLDNIVSLLCLQELDGLCGSLQNGTPWSFFGTTGYFLEFMRFLGQRGRVQTTTYLLGANCAFRRAVFEHVRFPDSNLGDDSAFSFALSNRGARLGFAPGIPVRHLNRTGVRQVLRYQVELGRYAFRYRSLSSPRIVRFFRDMPPLLLAMPPVIVAWIGLIVLRRSSWDEVIRYALTLPLQIVGNYFFVYGFHRGARESTAGSYEPLDTDPTRASWSAGGSLPR